LPPGRAKLATKPEPIGIGDRDGYDRDSPGSRAEKPRRSAATVQGSRVAGQPALSRVPETDLSCRPQSERRCVPCVLLTIRAFRVPGKNFAICALVSSLSGRAMSTTMSRFLSGSCPRAASGRVIAPASPAMKSHLMRFSLSRNHILNNCSPNCRHQVRARQVQSERVQETHNRDMSAALRSGVRSKREEVLRT